MDPATLAFVTSALGAGLVTALGKLAEKGIVDPGLEKGLAPLKTLIQGGYDKKAHEAKLRRAIEAAIAGASGPAQAGGMDALRWEMALGDLKNSPALAARAAAAAVELADADPKLVPDNLLRDLKLSDYRGPFAKFLFTLRRELLAIEGFGDGIRYADELHARCLLKGLYDSVRAALIATDEGQAFLVRVAPPDARPIEGLYLETVMRECGSLSLESRSRDQVVAEDEIKLEKVYIALNTRQSRRVEAGKEEGRRPPSPDRESESRPLSALRAVAESTHAVVLGDPGSGKSTFARHLCLCLAGARLGHADFHRALAADDLPRWDYDFPLPIFVRLRDFAADVESLPVDRDLRGQARHLLAYIEKELNGHKIEGLARRAQTLLDSGEALLVLDGLDEVTHPDRRNAPDNMPEADAARRVQVAQAIADLARSRCPRARLVVTCRVKQWRGAGGQPLPWAKPLGAFPLYELDDFTPDKIQHFIRHWFEAITARVVNAEAKRDSLWQAIADRPELTELAPKPILLTQMALVHADDVLPDSRVKLYQVCVELLLWKWERLRALQGGRQGKEADKFIAELGVPGLQRATLENALFEAVFAAHAGGEAEIPESILLARLRDALTAYNLSKERAAGPAQRFIDEWLREHNGLLIPAQADTFDFPHRSFREFIAGSVLMGSGYQPAPGEAAARPQPWKEAAPRLARADPAKWREVFRFAAAQSKVLADVCDALENLLAAPQRTDLIELDEEEAQLLAAEIVRDLKPDPFLNPANRWARATYDRIERNLIHLMRDTIGGDYPNDPPRGPSKPDRTLLPETRLEAGLLLDSLGWTPPDLWHFIPIANPHPPDSVDPLFYCAKYPLTVMQYQQFVNSPGYADPDIWRSVVGFDAEGNLQTDPGEEAWQWFERNGGPRRPGYWDNPRFGPPRRLFPVVGVTWYEAAAYCAWLARHWPEDEAAREALGGVFGGQFQLRLPREAEWAAAAGGEDEDRFPWGKGGEIRFRANTAESKLGRTTPVCMYPLGASPVGVMDMGGNAWEWQANLFQKGQEYRALRGGSWRSDQAYARPDHPSTDWNDHGFRVAAFPG